MTTEQPQASLSADQEQLGEYRAISIPAIVALLAGLVSPIALALPLFGWLFPLLAVVMGGQALWSIASHKGALTGRAMALTGLVLGLVILTALPARMIARHRLLAVQGREFADSWLELVRHGRLPLAHQHMLRLSSRRQDLAALDHVYRQGSELHEAMEDKFNKPPLERIWRLGTAARPEFDGLKEIVFGDQFDLVVVRYVLHIEPRPEEPPPEPLRINVILQRHKPIRSSDAYWQVAGVKTAEEKED